MTALLFISAQERLEDSGTLQYPSITFCPKYIWQVTSPAAVSKLELQMNHQLRFHNHGPSFG